MNSDGILWKDSPSTLPENLHNPEWNDTLEKSAKNIGEMSGGYRTMHIKVAQKATRLFNSLMIAGIVLGPISGVLSGIAITVEDVDFLPIISSIFGFASGIIITIIKFGKYDEVSSAHKIAAAKYSSLESNVRRQLVMQRECRPSAKQYLEWLNDSFDQLFSSAPLIPDKIYKNYCKYAKTHNLALPPIYGSSIIIHSDISATPKSIPISNGVPFQEVEPKTVNTSLRRIDTYVEPEKFTDGMMEYEIKRMMDFSTNTKGDDPKSVTRYADV